MSGLLGYANVGDAPGVAADAIAAMQYFPWQTSRIWAAPDGRLSLGQMGIGILNTEAQPVMRADGGAVLFMCGEFYNAAALRRQLESANCHPPHSASHPELALCAFQTWGPACACRLEGPFFVVVYEVAEQRLTLFNDRFGLYPHYYSARAGAFAFAPEVKGVLAAPLIPRTLNLMAVAEYMRFQQLLGEKTFHDDISLFPYGSVGVFELRTAAWTLQRYWDWDQIPDNPHVTFDEAVEAVGELLAQAVQRLTADSLRAGVFLSGGLDSRAIVGLIPPAAPPPVTATFGARGSRDVYYAAQLAAAVGSRHRWFDLPEDGSWVRTHVDLHLKLTEGFHSWIHMHGISMLSALRGVMDYNLSGWDGGTVMGHPDQINALYNDPVDFPTVLTELYHRFNQAYTWPGLTEAEERMLYQPAFGGRLWGLAFESMRQELARFWKFKRHYAAEYFYVVNHCWRHTSGMIAFARSHLEVRFPFWDYALIDFMYALKPSVRRDQLMYRHIITRRMPRLARIPYDKQEYLPTVNPLPHHLQALSTRARRRLRLYPQRATLYADYENYLRGGLRGWAEDILLSQRLADRGIFNPDYVRSLLARHNKGRELWTIGKIAPLMTFEMVLQNFFDSAVAAQGFSYKV